MGGDDQLQAVFLGATISILTPAWGVTTAVREDAPTCRNFNSHPRVGGDGCGNHATAIWIYFNSHPRVGGDLLNASEGKPLLIISILTPAWGVTLLLCRNGSPKRISILTPAWGVTT